MKTKEQIRKRIEFLRNYIEKNKNNCDSLTLIYDEIHVLSWVVEDENK